MKYLLVFVMELPFVIFLGNGFKVVRVDAQPIFTQMMKVMSIRDRANELFIQSTMGALRFALVLEMAIPVDRTTTCPFPALSNRVHRVFVRGNRHCRFTSRSEKTRTRTETPRAVSQGRWPDGKTDSASLTRSFDWSCHRLRMAVTRTVFPSTALHRSWWKAKRLIAPMTSQMNVCCTRFSGFTPAGSVVTRRRTVFSTAHLDVGWNDLEILSTIDAGPSDTFSLVSKQTLPGAIQPRAFRNTRGQEVKDASARHARAFNSDRLWGHFIDLLHRSMGCRAGGVSALPGVSLPSILPLPGGA